MVTLSYSQHIPDGAEFYFKPQVFSWTYKGLAISKTPEHQLYFIACPEGKVLPAELACRFTKLTVLQQAIDKWLADNPLARLPDIPPPPPPKRSHHAKTINIKEFNDEQDTIDNQT
jgi:hypothetical protein